MQWCVVCVSVLYVPHKHAAPRVWNLGATCGVARDNDLSTDEIPVIIKHVAQHDVTAHPIDCDLYQHKCILMVKHC